MQQANQAQKFRKRLAMLQLGLPVRSSSNEVASLPVQKCMAGRYAHLRHFVSEFLRNASNGRLRVGWNDEFHCDPTVPLCLACVHTCIRDSRLVKFSVNRILDAWSGQAEDRKY